MLPVAAEMGREGKTSPLFYDGVQSCVNLGDPVQCSEQSSLVCSDFKRSIWLEQENANWKRLSYPA